MTLVVSIGLILAAGRTLGPFSLAFGATAGTLLEVLLLAIAMRLHGIRLTPVRPRWTPSAKEVLSQYAPLAIGGIMLGGSNLIDQMMSATLDKGSVSALNFGTRVTGVII